MCTTCGCSDALHGPSDDHQHPRDLEHGHDATHTVSVGEDLLAVNNARAASNRHYFAHAGILALNLMSGPGAGKTTLLEQTIRALNRRVPVAVIEGDQQTSRDAERIRATGAPAVQINTGTACHLDARMVGHAIVDLAPQPFSLLFIENVGNLVCPAGFDLGEDRKVVILSVTEGEDKPLKYPHMFVAAHLLLIAKMDLLPHVDFDVDQCIAFAKQVNPALEVLCVSARSGAGMDAWIAWIERHQARCGEEARELDHTHAHDAPGPGTAHGAHSHSQSLKNKAVAE
jgi:hydrogenase nickel incorporation protein HypB